jgi:hypothetical protein
LAPQTTGERLAEDEFQPLEKLYRRYLDYHFEDGELDPSAIRFNEPPSVLRSQFSEPADALHANCAEGQEVTKYGVLSMPHTAVNQDHRAQTGADFSFCAVHDPLPACYAHSEIRCTTSKDGRRAHIEPTKDVRDKFRVKLAKALSVEIQAPRRNFQ